MADDEISHWRAQAMQCRRLVTALSDTGTILTLNEWVRELEAKIAEAEASGREQGQGQGQGQGQQPRTKSI